MVKSYLSPQMMCLRVTCASVVRVFESRWYRGVSLGKPNPHAFLKDRVIADEEFWMRSYVKDLILEVSWKCYL